MLLFLKPRFFPTLSLYNTWNYVPSPFQLNVANIITYIFIYIILALCALNELDDSCALVQLLIIHLPLLFTLLIQHLNTTVHTNRHCLLFNYCLKYYSLVQLRRFNCLQFYFFPFFFPPAAALDALVSVAACSSVTRGRR